jgi:O-antigen/teichoic acid export membrane protein
MIKNSFIYIFAEFVNKGIPFLLLPLLTKYLTPYDYGIIASFSSFVGFASIFIALSVYGAINVNFFKYSKEKLKIYISNSIYLLIISFLIAILLITVFKNDISSKLLLDTEWLYLGLLVAFSQTITVINLTLWTAEKKPKEYSLYQISQTFISTIMTITLVVGYSYNWQGQAISIIVGSLSFSILSLNFLNSRGYLDFKYNKDDIKDLLSFGVPLIPHQLSGWITTSGDRILLISMLGATATGLFSIGYQIGMIMSVLTMAFNKAWNPYIYEKLSKEIAIKDKVKIVKFTYLYFISMIFIVFFLNEIGYYIFKYWIDSKFEDSYKYVIYILIEYGLNGMYFMVVSYLFFFKKTKILALITFISSLLHILMSYVFIDIYGAIGVAYSGIISYFIMFISVWYYSNKIYSLPWFSFWRYK